MNTIKKFLALLDSNERSKIAILFALMFIGMILETFGIGLVVPLVYVISDPNSFSNHELFKDTVIANLNHENLIIACLITMLIVYSLKSIFMSFLVWYRFNFVFSFQANLSSRIFKIYLKQPYLFHLKADFSALTQNLIRETNLLAFYFSIPLLLIFSEVFVLIGILSFLFIMEPFGCSILMLIFGVPSYIFNLATKYKINHLGQERRIYEVKRLKHAQQGLRAIKEISLLGRQNFLMNLFTHNNHGLAKVEIKENTLQALPNIWLELLAVVGVIGLAFSMRLKGAHTSELLASLALFFAAAMRLIPSLTRLINSWGRVKYSKSAVNTLYTELCLINSCVEQKKTSHCISFKKTLRLKDVSFSYPDTSNPVCIKINLTIPFGSLIALVGSSGTGKSTLINIILGILSPNQGQVLVDEKNIHLNLREWQDHIGYVPQDIYIIDDTLRNNVAFGLASDEINEQAVENAIESAQLTNFITSLPDGLDTLLGENGCRLSSGQRQRLGIARALYHNPSILFMDEGTSALDANTGQEIMRVIDAMRGNKTVVIVTHNPENAAYCEKLYQLEQGQLKEVEHRTIEEGAMQ